MVGGTVEVDVVVEMVVGGEVVVELVEGVVEADVVVEDALDVAGDVPPLLDVVVEQPATALAANTTIVSTRRAPTVTIAAVSSATPFRA